MTRLEKHPVNSPLEGKYYDLKEGFEELGQVVRRGVRTLDYIPPRSVLKEHPVEYHGFSNLQGKVTGFVENFLQKKPLLGTNIVNAYKEMSKEERASLPVTCRMGLNYYLKEKENLDLDKEETRIRKELSDAYDEMFHGRGTIFEDDDLLGFVKYCGIYYYDEKTKENAITELARKQIIPSKQVIEEYTKHGLAKIKVPLTQRDCVSIDGPIIIDMQSLADPKPKYVWVRNQGLDSLTVFISSQGQPHKDCGVIEPNEDLEGFILMFSYGVNPKRQIPYRPCLFFVYSPKKAKESSLPLPSQQLL